MALGQTGWRSLVWHQAANGTFGKT